MTSQTSQQFPQPFGPYVLERFIAAGGMAEVFLARRRDGKVPGPVCVKRMLPEMMATAEYVGMFRDEGMLAVRLIHPNIVRVFEVGEADGRLFMAMEYVDGLDVGTLQKRLKLRGQNLTIAQALKIGVEMCAGLSHAHTLADDHRRSLNLIHRDVSPQNLLVSQRGDVKVMDFGIAKASGRETRTKTGLIKGKIAYMAPEQALGQHIDQRLDQFAAGIVVWELLTGERLFAEATELATFEKIIRRPTAPPSSVRSDVPAFLDAIVLRALAKKPEERYPSIGQFAAALSTALDRVGDADLGALMHNVMTGGAPAPRAVAAPPPSPTGARISHVSDADTRLATPRAQPAERLPTAAMMALPSIDDGFSHTLDDGPGALTLDSTLEAPPLPPVQAALQPRISSQPSLPTPSPVADLRVPPMRTPPPSPSQSARIGTTPQTRSSVLAAPATGEPGRGFPVVAVIGALVIGVGVGFGAARGLAGPDRGSAECAMSSTAAGASERAKSALQRAELAWNAGDLAQAQALATEANLASGSADAHMLLGRIALQRGDRITALGQFRCVVTLDPSGQAAAELERLLKTPAG